MFTPREGYPKPKVAEPCVEILSDMAMGAIDSRCTDGCIVMHPTDKCKHGFPAWPLYFGMVSK